MKEAINKTGFLILLTAAILMAASIGGCKEKPQPIPAEHNNPSANPADKPGLSSIVAQARGWGTSFTRWHGKEAPDFTVTDLDGKKHTLSEYKGKNVILVFWATWCRPCIIEIPHLIELRNSLSEDKLAILGISYIGPMNSADTIKKFVVRNPSINYTVTATDMATMPRPYNLITGIPSSFFIDPQGKIKLATEGLISLNDTRAIIEAEN